ncbi:MAG: hypothetical protein MSIBF_03330 [Candidatus Altiarchaeales archaeon IMC4]|nr:MAG: hypothetical protein MSIBF_03330 [Candidatus Altiarchaeales archaeon IMC4]
MSDVELERIRQERMQQMMQQANEESFQQQMQEKEIGMQIHAIINKILSPDARERLGNLRTAMPEFARQVEILLIQLYQAGRLPKVLSDKEFKEILVQIDSKRRGNVK